MRRQRGQSSVEFGASAIVLFLLLFGLIDLGRVFYFDVGLTGATREGARQASWFVLPGAGGGSGTNPSLYDDDGWAQDPCPYEPNGNPTGDPNAFPGIKQAVDCNLNKYHLPAAVNQPLLYICYANTPGLDLTVAPTDDSYKGRDVNVILVMNFGYAGGFLPNMLGTSLHIVANTHMVVGSY